MNANNSHIRLLTLNDKKDEASRLTSMLVNAGKSLDAQHVESEQALVKVLQEHNWDLMIGHTDTSNLPIDTALKHIRQLNKDVPVILLTDKAGSQPIVEGLKRGVADVLVVDEDQHLLQAINRELNNREYRSQSRYAQRKLKEIERRNQQLLDSSKDAIAFVEDGMFLYVNESFAEMLGYESKDDLECMPMMDVIDPSDQSMLRDYLKDITQKGNVLDTQVIAFKVLDAQNHSKAINVDISLTNYDEETCIQLLVPGVGISQAVQAASQGAETTAPESTSPIVQTTSSHLLNHDQFIEKLHKALDVAIDNESTGSVMYVSVDDLAEKVISRLGLIAVERTLKHIGNHLKTLIPQGAVLCQFGSHGFLVLTADMSATDALPTAEALCAHLRDYYIDIDGSSLQFKYYVGIGLFSETTTSPDKPIEHAMQANQLALSSEDKLAVLFEPQQDENDAPERSDKDMARLIQKSLDNGRFKLLFQPILSLRGAPDEHYEVFVRMLDSKGKEIAPLAFLDISDDMGLTAKIDRWVIIESLKKLTKHRAANPNTRLIINLSIPSLKDPSLTDWLTLAFKAAKLPTNSLIFQINEEHVNNHINQAKTLAVKLAGIGAVVSISRFGCVDNPLNALQHVPASYIKLDGQYTKQLQDPEADPEVLDKLLTELHTIEKITIIPMVENAGALAKLWQSGVHYIQGYYLQAPSENMDYEFEGQ